MLPSPRYRALALAVGLGVSSSAFGQSNPSNANLSTGSGAGTSPGVNPGSSPSGENTYSGNAPGTTPLQNYPRVLPDRGLPTDITGTTPAPMSGDVISNLSQEELDAIDARILGAVRQIAKSVDRAMAMERVARAKLYAHQPGDTRLDDALAAIDEGGRAALLVDDLVRRDILLTNLVRVGLSVADELTREGMTNTSDVTGGDMRGTWPARRRFDWIARGENVRRSLGELARRITNSTLRSEMVFRVVEGTSQASQTLGQASLQVNSSRPDLKGLTPMLNRMADRSLVFASNEARTIDKPTWRDHAMVSIAIAASASEQFARGIEISKTIPQPAYRSDALIRLAESQARHNLRDATDTYAAAALAVASIPKEDPRATIASVLIDSLISTGRFDDARACVPLYPDRVRQADALGAIAENQGERRLTNSALAWIERDAPPELKDQLRLRVTNGVLKAFEKGKNNANQGIDTGGRNR